MNWVNVPNAKWHIYARTQINSFGPASFAHKLISPINYHKNGGKLNFEWANVVGGPCAAVKTGPAETETKQQHQKCQPMQ